MSNVDGNFNTLLGHYSGYSAYLKNYNVMLGYYSGFNADSASQDVFIGSNSGKYADNSSNSVSVGFNSGFNNNGTDNVFLGSNSGYRTQSGDGNIFIGNSAGYNNVTGSSLVCIGDSSGLNSTAGENVFIGSSTGKDNTTGTSNTFIGYKSGRENQIGDGNTFVGHQAGFRNNNDYNTFIGLGAGAFNSVGSDNVYIGAATGMLSAGSGNVFIGRNVNMSGDNLLAIDNEFSSSPLIYGEFDNNFVRIYGKLSVNGAEASDAQFYAREASSTTSTHYAGSFLNDGGATVDMGIKIQAGADDGAGYNGMLICYDGNGGFEGGLYNHDGTLELYTVSDRRLKENIVNTSVNGLEIINNLRVVDYNFKTLKGVMKTGFIAQEAQEAYKPMTIDVNDEDIIAISMDALVPILHKAIQELSTKVDKLEQENRELKALIKK